MKVGPGRAEFRPSRPAGGRQAPTSLETPSCASLGGQLSGSHGLEPSCDSDSDSPLTRPGSDWARPRAEPEPTCQWDRDREPRWQARPALAGNRAPASACQWQRRGDCQAEPTMTVRGQCRALSSRLGSWPLTGRPAGPLRGMPLSGASESGNLPTVTTGPRAGQAASVSSLEVSCQCSPYYQ